MCTPLSINNSLLNETSGKFEGKTNMIQGVGTESKSTSLSFALVLKSSVKTNTLIYGANTIIIFIRQNVLFVPPIIGI